MSLAKSPPVSETDQVLRPAPALENSKEQNSAKNFAIAAAKLLSESNCSNVLIIDVRDINPLTNYLIIATGTSDRQLKGVAEYVKDLGAKYDLEKFVSERDQASKWLVEDYVDVIVHLFEPETRATYDLEMLWGDGQIVEWGNN